MANERGRVALATAGLMAPPTSASLNSSRRSTRSPRQERPHRRRASPKPWHPLRMFEAAKPATGTDRPVPKHAPLLDLANGLKRVAPDRKRVQRVGNLLTHIRPLVRTARGVRSPCGLSVKSVLLRPPPQPASLCSQRAARLTASSRLAELTSVRA